MVVDPGGIGREVAGYRIIGVIGEGAMGVVYRAEQVRLGRRAAIRLIAPDLARDPDLRTRFQQEAELAASIDHPHLIPIYDAGEDKGLLYIAMRLVAGQGLNRLIASEGRVAPDRAASLVSQVADALDAAHAAGLVHRNVKPGNVLIAKRTGVDHAFLSDLGLTESLDPRTTGSGHAGGTPDCLAPEQIQGHRVDARTDAYALGCVLYEALTGEVAFPRDTPEAQMHAHVSDPPPSPVTVNTELSPAFDEIIHRALAKKPDDRYPSAGDLGRAAVAAAAGERGGEPERSVAVGPPAQTHPMPPRTTPPAPALEPLRRQRSASWGRRVLVAVLALSVLAAVAVAAVLLIPRLSESDDPEGSAGPAPVPEKRFRDPAFGITFKYPKTYEVLHDVSFSRSAGNEAVATAAVGADKKNRLAVQRFELNQEVTKRNLDAVQPEADAVFSEIAGEAITGVEVSAGGLPGLEYFLADLDRPPGGQTRATALFDGSTQYLLNCQSTPEERAAVQAACDRALETLRSHGATPPTGATETSTRRADVEQAALAYGEASGSAACAHLSSTAISALGGIEACEKEFKNVPSADFTLDSVDVAGDTATASVQNQQSGQVIELGLVREAGQWKVSSFPGLE